jgi:hypothetical protein
MSQRRIMENEECKLESCVTNVWEMSVPWEDIIVSGSKEQTLNNFLDYFKHLPVQGSAEWHRMRSGMENGVFKQVVIGGSEVATILGNNNYSKPRKWLEEKISGKSSSFTGNHATRWGNFFERQAFAILEKDMNIKIYECGSIPGHSYKGKVIQRCSPDGVGLVKNSNGVDEIVFFEAKCPITRMPDGAVPNNYKDQLQVGLFTIRMADYALFIDSIFETGPSIPDGWTGWRGYAIFCGDYSRDVDYGADIDGDETEQPMRQSTVYEVENDNDPEFQRMLRLSVGGCDDLKIVYSRPYYCKGDTLESETTAMFADIDSDLKMHEDAICIVKWRLIRQERIVVDRKPGYAAQLIKKLESFVDKVDKVIADPNVIDDVFPLRKKQKTDIGEDILSQVEQLK